MAFDLGSTNAATKLSPAALENVTHWLEQPKYSEYRDELIGMIEGGQWKDLEDAFFKVIEFGTAGRRGTTGIGSNRINRVTMGESAQALCEYALKADENAAYHDHTSLDNRFPYASDLARPWKCIRLGHKKAMNSSWQNQAYPSSSEN